LIATLFQSYADTPGNPRVVPFDSDAATGLSSNKVYTHAVDFGNIVHEKPLSINGVEFFTTAAANMTGDKTPRGCGWENFPPNPNHPDPEKTMLAISTPAGENVRDLLLGHTWGLANKVMRLTDLKPGSEYELRIFNRVYGGGRKRGCTFIFIPDEDDENSPRVVFSYNQDDQSVKDNMIVYRYRAGASGKLGIYMEPWDTVYTWHAYGFTNEELPRNTGSDDNVR